MVPRCHDGVDGSECTARWVVQGVAGHCLGYVLHDALHMLHSTYLPRTVSRHSMQGQTASIYHSTHHLTGQTVGSGLCAAASISAQVGWRAAAMTKTKGGRQERDARFGYCTRDCTCTVVPSPSKVSAHSAVSSSVAA